MKHLFPALLFLVSMNLAHASVDDEFEQLSRINNINQSLLDKTRVLLKKPITDVPLENFDGVDAICCAIDYEFFTLTLALASRGVPLFITDRSSKLTSPLVFALSKFPAPEFNVLLQCAISRQRYDINQLDNNGMSLLLHLFKLPNFTPSIEMIELLVVTYKADVDDQCQDAARANLSSFTPEDLPRVNALMNLQSQPTVQHATPDELSALNKKIKARLPKGQQDQINKDPQADVLATKNKLRFARNKRPMRGKPKAPHSVNDLSIHVNTTGASINAEQSKNPTAKAVALTDKKRAFKAAITKTEENEDVWNRRTQIQDLKDKFQAEKNELNEIESEQSE